MPRLSIGFFLIILASVSLIACSGGVDYGTPALGKAVCGDSICSPEENSLLCPADCTASCGDGMCTYGEFCANCPADCDCATLAATPPMGWNSWNKFHCEIDETMMREMSDAFVSSGLKAAGYRYFNLDDCWQESRAADGTIQAHPTRFASGMAALSDYVHEKGLLFGLYTCAGSMTCQEKPGSQGYEDQDAASYAAWKVDYLKEDWCFTEGLDPRTQYRKMHEAIAKTDYPILLSLCDWGNDSPWIWGPSYGSIWRTTGDITDLFASVLLNFTMNAKLAAFAGPGHFNDPDMLEVGNGGLSHDEAITHMSWWAIVAAPLIAGNDLRSMDEETKAILLNAEVIAVDQDPAGLQGVLAGGNDDIVVYARPLTETGARAVVITNTYYKPRSFTFSFADLGLKAGSIKVRDLWSHSDLGLMDSVSLTLAKNASVMYKVVGEEPELPTGMPALSALAPIYAANSLGPVEKNTSVGTKAEGDGASMAIAGTTYEKGLGVAPSVLMYHLGGHCTRLTAQVGVDDEVAVGTGSVVFEVWGDGKKLYTSPTLTRGQAAERVDVSVEGVARLKLVVTAAGDSIEGDHADWADAVLTCP